MKRSFIALYLIFGQINASEAPLVEYAKAKSFDFKRYLFNSSFRHMLGITDSGGSFLYDLDSSSCKSRHIKYSPSGYLCHLQLANSGDFLVSISGENRQNLEVVSLKDATQKTLDLRTTVLQLAISPDSSKIAACKLPALDIIDSQTLAVISKILHDHIPHPYEINSAHQLTFSNNSDIIIELFYLLSSDREPIYSIKKSYLKSNISVDTTTCMQPIKVLIFQNGNITFSCKDGTIKTAFGSGSCTRFYPKARCKTTQDLELAQIKCFEISNEDAFIAIKNWLILDTEESFLTSKTVVTENIISKISVSPNGNYIATLSEDNMLRIYDRHGDLIRSPIAILNNHLDVKCIHISDNFRIVVDAPRPEIFTPVK